MRWESPSAGRSMHRVAMSVSRAGSLCSHADRGCDAFETHLGLQMVRIGAWPALASQLVQFAELPEEVFVVVQRRCEAGEVDAPALP